MGLDTERTRVVVDLSEGTKYSIENVTEDGSIALAFTNSNLARTAARSGSGWGIVRRFSVKPNGSGGETVFLDLSMPAEVVTAATVDGPDGSVRVMLDLVPIAPGGARSTGKSGGANATVRSAAFSGSQTGIDAKDPDRLSRERLARLEAAMATQQERLEAQYQELERQRIAIQKLRRALIEGEHDQSQRQAASAAAPLYLAQVAPQPVGPKPVGPKPVSPKPVGPKPVAPQSVQPQPVAPAQSAAPPVPDEPRAQEAERPEPEKPQDELLLSQGGILLPPGRGQFEISAEHTHASSNRINIGGFTIFEAIVIGTIRVDQLDRDVLTNSMTARFGLLPRLQIEGRVPYIYRKDEEVLAAGTNNQSVVKIDGDGIGDVEGTITWQPIIGRGAIPNTLVRLRAKSRTGKDSFEIATQSVGTGGQTRLVEPPTGSGFYTLQPGLTAVWRSDPVAFFASGGYAFNLPRDLGGAIGELDPGDTMDFSVGFNIALSDSVGVNMTFVNQFTGETKQNGVKSPGTSANDARLQVGASIGLTPSFSILASAGIGLTEESPDYTFGLSGTYNFDLASVFGGE